MSRFLSPLRSPSRALAGIGDPFSDLHREMNRLFDDFMGASVPSLGVGPMMVTPRLDVRESGNELRICADLPGVKPEDVELRIEGSTLTLRGEKANEAEDKREDYYLMERSYGRFQRSLQLPYAPDPSRVHADFDNGVLTIHVPKEAHQERSQRIAIQAHPTQAPVTPQVASKAAASAAVAGSSEMPH